MKPTKFALAAWAFIVLLAPSAARADTVAGTFNISGNLTLTSTTINWGGTATIGSAPTGIYSALGGTNIGITNLSSATEPVGSVFSPQSFLSFTADPSLSALLINSISAGVDGSAQCGVSPAAAGQICTPSSPTGYLQAMDFSNSSSTSSTMAWFVSGVSADGTETWQGTFTTVFSVPYQTILADFASGAPLNTSYSATIRVLENPISIAPEPSSIALLGTGLLGLIGAARRRRPA